MREFSMLLTLNEAARQLGFSSSLRLLPIVRSGRLRMAGQTIDGRMLFREHEVEQLADELTITAMEGEAA